MIASGWNLVEVLVWVSSGWLHLLALPKGKDEESDKEQEDPDSEPLVEGHHVFPSVFAEGRLPPPWLREVAQDR
jgi:hypothetical protein